MTSRLSASSDNNCVLEVSGGFFSVQQSAKRLANFSDASYTQLARGSKPTLNRMTECSGSDHSG